MEFDTKDQIYTSTITVGDFNISLSPINRSFRPKKSASELIGNIDQINIVGIHNIFYPVAAE
jgi:hypothetical protein